MGAAADYFFATKVTARARPRSCIGAIPIERTKVGRKSADLARVAHRRRLEPADLPRGRPQPRWMGPAVPGGAAYIAQRCGVPVVPIHIEGSGRILRKGKSRAIAHVGHHHLRWAAAIAGGEDARKFAARIEREVAVLGDEAATDWWQARRRAYAGDTPSMTGPGVGAWRRAWELSAKDKKVRRAKRRWPAI